MTGPTEDSAQANRLPGVVSTVVTLPSKGSARWATVQKNIEDLHGKIPTVVANPTEDSAGQAHRLPGKISMAEILQSRGSASWAIVQKKAALNLQGKVPMAATDRTEDSAGQANRLLGKESTAVALPSKYSAR